MVIKLSQWCLQLANSNCNLAIRPSTVQHRCRCYCFSGGNHLLGRQNLNQHSIAEQTKRKMIVRGHSCFVGCRMLFLLLQAAVVEGSPYVLLQNKAPKCWQIDAPYKKVLLVKYQAPGKLMYVEMNEFVIRLSASFSPIYLLYCCACWFWGADLVIIKDDEEGQEGEAIKEIQRNLEDGQDAIYNERFQQRIETLKRAVCEMCILVVVAS
jgi:hypothetical protein